MEQRAMKILLIRLCLLLGFGASVLAGPAGAGSLIGGNTTETFRGPGPWIDVTDPAFGAKGDGVTDDWRAIQNGLDAAAAPVCATVALTCTSTNTFVISQTLKVPSCVKFRGACGGGPGITKAPIKLFGSILKWVPSTPPTTPTPVVLYQGVAHSSQEDMDIDCQSVALTVGTQYVSENGTPPSSFNEFDRLLWNGCHIGFAVGELTDTAIPPQDCVQLKGYPPPANPLPPGCYEADQFRLEHFIVYGTGADTTAEGVRINALFGAQDSVIRLGSVQLVNVGIHVLSTAGLLTISEFTGGSVVAGGLSPALIQCDNEVVTCPNLINNESEGNWTFAVLDSSCNPGGKPGTPVWIANQWNNNVLVNGCENITSIGNGTGVGQMFAAGSFECTPYDKNGIPTPPCSHVVSINDIWGPQPSNAGNVTTLAQGLNADPSIIAHNQILAAAPAIKTVCSFPTNANAGDVTSCETATSGSFFLGSDSLASLSRDSSGNIVSQQGFRGPIAPKSTGAETVGSPALPYDGIFVGNTAADNTEITGAVTGARTLTLPDGNSSTSLVGSLTTTAAATDDILIQGVTAMSHCVLTPTNSSAAANIASAFVASKAARANTITIAHLPVANMTYDIQCTPN
jgi:hypothetical protein